MHDTKDSKLMKVKIRKKENLDDVDEFSSSSFHGGDQYVLEPQKYKRRNFLRRTYLVSAAVALVIGGGVIVSQGDVEPPIEGLRFLDKPSYALLSWVALGVIPNLLNQSEAHISLIQRVDFNLALLSEESQSDARRLFSILYNPLIGYLLGVRQESSDQLQLNVTAFLLSLRRSRFADLRGAYKLLVGMISMQWYQAPEAWPSGFPGIPKAYSNDA